jgi:hypothetical protein
MRQWVPDDGRVPSPDVSDGVAEELVSVSVFEGLSGEVAVAPDSGGVTAAGVSVVGVDEAVLYDEVAVEPEAASGASDEQPASEPASRAAMNVRRSIAITFRRTRKDAR